ncbi:MAG: ferritin [Deltaproteobacteria bacterium]|nr:ferritin [Deltaproteobacteria bacterium]
MAIAAKIASALNAHIGLEADASNYYLALSSACAEKKWTGCAKFFLAQSAEEREHLLKIFRYLVENNVVATVPEQKAPAVTIGSMRDLFAACLKSEQRVSASVTVLIDLAVSLKDYATNHFLQWYVAEQQEEEQLFQGLIDEVTLVGEGGTGIYLLDKSIGARAASS